MKIRKRILSSILALLILPVTLSGTATAAAPKVSVDESAYVNLDYYGTPTNINIVKSCNLNGNQQFTDYGEYEKVSNMSNNVVPTMKNGAVSWNLNNYKGRFYYECTPKKGTVVLPWNVDVSYSLNGTPIAASKLVGASGLIQIDVKVTPNTKANMYYRNNMLLQMQTIVDMSKASSVDAPGAQVQTIGNKKIVLFAALPGEKDTFTLRIGTNSFETDGILLTMVPGTLSQLQDVKDLKDNIDTFRDSMNSIYDSTNALLQTAENMQSGLSRAKSGLSSLDRANSNISVSKDSLFDKSETALADLSKVASNTAAMIPHINEGENAIEDLNYDLNAMTKTIESTKTELEKYKASIKNVQDDIEELRDVVKDVNSKSDERDELLQRTRSDIEDMQADLENLSDSSSDLSNKLNAVSSDISTLSDAMKSVSGELSGIAEKYLQGIENEELKKVLMALYSNIQQMLSYVDSTLSDLAAACDSTSELLDQTSDISENGKDYLNTVNSSISLIEDYFEDFDRANEVTDDMLSEQSEILSNTSSLLTKSETLIDNISAVNDTANKYKSSSIKALQDMGTLLDSMTKGLNSSQNFLSSFESVLKNSSGDISQGNSDMLKGLIGVLKQSLEGIKSVPTMRKANDSIKSTADKEIDKFENENRLLYLDPKAELISFTSSKNPSPRSIQVILRTQEINKDSGNENITNADSDAQDKGVLYRIIRVFVKLKQAVVSAFSDINQ
ncbi:Chromosome segregation protein [Clostridiaceae bacterium BL-3]|nr:Chromosome segregation protein [Clostridiaceae bacterium BL-3]